MSAPLPRGAAFTRFWTAEVATTFSWQMLLVAIGWQIYDLTGRALDLGFVGLAHFCAQILATLPAGQIADRLDRRRVAATCQVVQSLVALTLAAGSLGGWLDGPVIYACTFVVGTATTFQSPSLRALLPSLVTEAQLPQAIAWSATSRTAAVITGPALGGVLLLFGAPAVYFLGVAIFLGAGAILVGIPRPARTTRREPATLRFMLGGIHYIVQRPVILGAISLDLFATLLGGAVALLPIYARDILETGPWGLGLLRAAPAVGGVLASAWLMRHPLQRGVGRILFACIAIFGAAIVVFGLSTALPLSLAALAIMGAADMVSVVIRSSLIQLETPEEMRGRVSAVNGLFTGTSNQLGQFESGVTAAWFGTVPAVVIGGVGTLLVAAIWMRLFPDLIRRETLRSPLR